MTTRTKTTTAHDDGAIRAINTDPATWGEGRHRVFVYGTLRQGFVNHDLLAGATHLGRFETTGRFRLIDCGMFPALALPVRWNDALAGNVIGELYEVDTATMVRLDRLEGVNHDEPRAGMYYRERVTVRRIDGNVTDDDDPENPYTDEPLPVTTYYYARLSADRFCEPQDKKLEWVGRGPRW